MDCDLYIYSIGGFNWLWLTNTIYSIRILFGCSSATATSNLQLHNTKIHASDVSLLRNEITNTNAEIVGSNHTWSMDVC
jgi:hypothetical protein